MKILEGQILARAIRRVLACDGELRCAVAFWGPKLAAQAAARSAKIVLDISMGGTSQYALTALGVPGNGNVRVLNGLHAKIYISPDCAILTSANASRNALGADGVGPALKEAGVVIDRFEYPAAYESMERLFARYWKVGHVADTADFERAVKVSSIVAARDHSPSPLPLGSVLDQLVVSPDMFSRTSFIFGDARLTPEELTLVQEAYADESDSTGDEAARQLICATRDREESRVLEECAYIIMYWLGPRKGIRAFHDVVRVEA